MAHETTASASQRRDEDLGSAVPGAAMSARAAISLEANSGSAFVRKLASRLDPVKIPRGHTFSWNAFLGSRRVPGHVPTLGIITNMLSKTRMQDLSAVFFDQIHPTYGFVDKQELLLQIESRWSAPECGAAYDALLCSIAALGCLFSQVHADSLEQDLLETARALLGQTMSEVPDVRTITASLLRAVYLRIAGTHYEAWMASCMVMHMIEAAGVTADVHAKSTWSSSTDTARRLVLIAQHLNIWMSFDMGLTRVALNSAENIPMPLPRSGDFTPEITALLALSVDLDPERKPTAEELEIALHALMSRVHSTPPTILAQCNLALCLCRRLRSLEAVLTETILQGILTLTTNGVAAARSILAARAPWHHMAYVPFQIVCVLLAIDTVSSISQLRDAMQCLKDISLVYDTQATQEALSTARSLVRLHQKGKEIFAAALDDVLKDTSEASSAEHANTTSLTSGTEELASIFAADFPGLGDFDMETLLNPDFFWNAGSYGIS
ncbi:Transcription factor [Moelleriella libera RCEF 2490]|uniref:Transcription factor n=1 Tax=Moelleriella libera RCEF 2490 TaxID=1081109 RepID=A0A167VXW0_9HYPO|nr:Transcription factor [Moelleriella libera RCEF 2490]